MPKQKKNISKKKKKILITGACGFLGINVSKYLFQKGYIVYGIGNKNSNIQKKDLIHYSKIIQKELKYEYLKKNFKEIDYIIHCAGRVIGLGPEEDYNKNVNSTLELIKYLSIKRKKKIKIIFLSTIAVYKTLKGKKISEKFLLQPMSHYALNKKISEDLLIFYSKKFYYDLLIARTTSLYGEGLQRQFIFDACKKLSINRPLFFGSGKEVRDWLHVKDMSRLIFRFIQKSFTNINIINCGSGEGFQIKDVLTKIEKHFNLTKKIRFNKVSDTNPSILIANISKAKSFNWKPNITLSKGLNEYVSWFKKKF